MKNIFKKLGGNISTKCEFCKKSVKRKSAHFEEVKLPHLVHPKNTGFCSKKCAKNYKEYSESRPKSVSLCSSCPVPPTLLEKEN